MANNMLRRRVASHEGGFPAEAVITALLIIAAFAGGLVTGRSESRPEVVEDAPGWVQIGAEVYQLTIDNRYVCFSNLRRGAGATLECQPLPGVPR